MLWLSRRNNAGASSFLQSFMASTQANASDHLRVLADDSHDHHRFFLEERDNNGDDDDERSIDSNFIRRILLPAPADVNIPFEEVGVNQQQEQVAAASPVRKKSRLAYQRKPHHLSHWWLEHLTPVIR